MNEYVLGHSERELERLRSQARRIEPITRRILEAAGLGPGMRVLDVGSGAGDVAFLAAELVGESGEVVGVDRSAAALEVARSRAPSNVSFLEGDHTAATGMFDAAIGRYVLQFQPEPATMLREIAALVRPGGIVAFHELDWDGVRSWPPIPTFDRCAALCREKIGSAAETRMGGKLFATFVAAGLPAPSLRLEALAGVEEPLRIVADLAGSLGVTSEEPDALFEQMVAEARETTSVAVGNFQFGAWAQSSRA